MVVSLLVTAALCFLLGWLLHWWKFDIVRGNIQPSGSEPEPLLTPELVAEMMAGIAENSSRMDDLTLAVDEGIRFVKRAENRVQKTISSARRFVRESGLEPFAPLEAEAAELRDVDGDGSDEPGLPALPEPVDEDSGVPGVSEAELQRILYG